MSTSESCASFLRREFERKRGGFLEIHDNVVRVLSDTAEKGQEIDVSQAEKDLKKAQDDMVNPALGIDIASALIAV